MAIMVQMPPTDAPIANARVSRPHLGDTSRISSFRVGVNSYGETVLGWKLSSAGRQPAETFIVVATFNGTTAPLGAVPVLPGVSIYRFVDHVLNAYVGKKTYYIVLIHADGSVTGDGGISVTKETNVKRNIVVQVNKGESS